jgi:uncharacterized protein YidB (DUF937 family)
MSLLNGILGALGDRGGGPLQGILSSLLGGGGQGGLSSLLTRFDQAGLGHVAQSWVGTGENRPVSPEQLQGVFGDEEVRSMAGQAGLAPNDFLSQLSRHLPDVVDRLTPHGRMPE